jgi:hypothetical protein
MEPSNPKEEIIAISPKETMILFSDRIEFSKDSGINRGPLLLSDFSHYQMRIDRNLFLVIILSAIVYFLAKYLTEEVYLSFFAQQIDFTSGGSSTGTVGGLINDLEKSIVDLEMAKAGYYGLGFGALSAAIFNLVVENFGFVKSAVLEFFDNDGTIVSHSFPFSKRTEVGLFTDEIDKQKLISSQNK